ncbi:MAG: ATP-binding cassette domain-containing protein [Clostridia bacterium]|nr:ATP-binding cassette domain-containing protein [Clostridia bacterium]
MIKIENLSYSFGNYQALDGVSLTLDSGTITGLVGVNGAGKSTLLRLMAGVYKADVGFVTYDGENVNDENTRKDIFFLPDEPYYTHQDTMKSIISMYKHFYPTLDLNTYFRLVKELNIDECKPLRACSKGMRRQIYIALAISIRPKYLLLDEAFDGLDPATRDKVKNELINMVEKDDTTIIIASHSLREIEDFCDKYAIVDGKSVKSSGDISSITEECCKFMLAFKEEASKELFVNLPVVNINVNGKFVTAVFKGEGRKIKERLIELSPVVLEEQPFDFEEAFICEVKKDDKL